MPTWDAWWCQPSNQWWITSLQPEALHDSYMVQPFKSIRPFIRFTTHNGHNPQSSDQNASAFAGRDGAGKQHQTATSLDVTVLGRERQGTKRIIRNRRHTFVWINGIYEPQQKSWCSWIFVPNTNWFCHQKSSVFSLQVQNNPPKKPGLLYFSPPPFLGDVFNLCLKKPPCWLNIHLTVADVRRKNKKKISQIFRSFPPIP